MTRDEIAAFWERLADITSGVLGTDDGAARQVPMTHQLRDGDPTIWFVTHRDTDLARAAASGRPAATYVVAEGGKGLYAVIKGGLIRVEDRALRDDLWSVSTDAWFENGRDDPDVCIIGLLPEGAEVWLTTTSGLSFAYNVMRAQITGEQPDIGSHGTIPKSGFLR